MELPISSLLTNINVVGGLVNNNRFYFQMSSFPRIVSADINIIKLQSYFCRRVELPSTELDMFNVENEGVIARNIPKTNRVSAMNVSFLMTNDYNLYNYLTLWAKRSGIGSKEPFRDPNMEHAYYDDVIGSFTITSLDRNGNKKCVWTFHDVWPTSVSSIEFDSEAETTPQNCDVSFIYNSFDVMRLT